MGRIKHQQSARRNHYQNKKSNNFHPYSSNQNTIQVGQHGFFVTYCASKESFVRNEIYNLLNRFADQLFGSEFSDDKEVDTTDLNDLDSALEQEKTKLNESKKKFQRFRIVKSGTKHSLFVTTTLPFTSLNKLIESVFQTSIQAKEQHSRYIERLLPVVFICKAYEDDLRKTIIKKEFLEQILLCIDENDSTIDTIWFDVQAKKSNNTQLKSGHLEEIIISDLQSRNAEDLNGKVFKRDYKKPQIHILIHVIKNVILISIVRNFDVFKKYNLATINLATTTATSTTTTAAAEEGEQQQQNKITFNEDDDDDDDDDDDEEETNN